MSAPRTLDEITKGFIAPNRVRAACEEYAAGEVAALRQVLSDIATISHAGGVFGLNNEDAMVAVRKLSLSHWDRSVRNVRERLARILTEVGK